MPRLQKEDLVQFVLHASLDALDAKVWSSPTMFFKNVDKFNDVNISAFVTAGRENTRACINAHNEMSSSAPHGRGHGCFVAASTHRSAIFPAIVSARSHVCSHPSSTPRVCVYADTRFLLLHDPHKDDNIIKAFFYEVRDSRGDARRCSTHLYAPATRPAQLQLRSASDTLPDARE